MTTERKRQQRFQRRRRVRVHIHGTASRPRLSVYRSNRGLSAQLINDDAGTTLVAGSTLSLGASGKTKTDLARLLGERIAEQAVKAGISAAVFDRNGYRYHGRVAALADGARAKGLTI